VRPQLPEYRKYFVSRVEGRGRNKDQAEFNYHKDLEYILSWIRGELHETTDVEYMESYDGTWLATSTLTFRRKQGKVYRR